MCHVSQVLPDHPMHRQATVNLCVQCPYQNLPTLMWVSIHPKPFYCGYSYLNLESAGVIKKYFKELIYEKISNNYKTRNWWKFFLLSRLERQEYWLKGKEPLEETWKVQEKKKIEGVCSEEEERAWDVGNMEKDCPTSEEVMFWWVKKLRGGCEDSK